MESNMGTLIKALKIIAKHYKKMLLVNLSNYTFVGVKVPDDEKPFIPNDKIVDYWNWFCSSKLIHDDDREKCIEYGKNVKFGTHLIYRRRVNNEWHHVLMELTDAETYEDGTTYCVCSVRDIDKFYTPEYESIVDHLGTVDGTTNLYNKVAFLRDKERLKNEKIGIIYADLNGLKYTNDTLGHNAGDELIQRFANLLAVNFARARCYHLSGDEFAVIASGEALSCFEDKTIAFKKTMWIAMEYPIASLGYAIGEAGQFDLALEKAEKEMYDDKRIFYSRFPKLKRK